MGWGGIACSSWWLEGLIDDLSVPLHLGVCIVGGVFGLSGWGGFGFGYLDLVLLCILFFGEGGREGLVKII